MICLYTFILPGKAVVYYGFVECQSSYPIYYGEDKCTTPFCGFSGCYSNFISAWSSGAVFVGLYSIGILSLSHLVRLKGRGPY